jgi:hypothetical protein
MNLLELSAKVYDILTETPTNTAFPSAFVRHFINVCYKQTCRDHEFPFLEEETEIDFLYTTTSDAGTSENTTLYLTDATKVFNGMKLAVISGAAVDVVKVQSKSGNTVTLVSPGLKGSYSKDVRVAGLCIEKPADFLKSRNITLMYYNNNICTGYSTVKSGEIELVNRYPVYNAVYIPLYYFEKENHYQFWPAPNEAYTVGLSYLKSPADLTGDTDTPVFSSDFHDMLAYYAASRCYAKDENYNSATFWNGEYLRVLASLKKFYENYSYELLSMKDGWDPSLSNFQI